MVLLYKGSYNIVQSNCNNTGLHTNEINNKLKHRLLPKQYQSTQFMANNAANLSYIQIKTKIVLQKKLIFLPLNIISILRLPQYK